MASGAEKFFAKKKTQLWTLKVIFNYYVYSVFSELNIGMVMLIQRDISGAAANQTQPTVVPRFGPPPGAFGAGGFAATVGAARVDDWLTSGQW